MAIAKKILLKNFLNIKHFSKFSLHFCNQRFLTAHNRVIKKFEAFKKKPKISYGAQSDKTIEAF